MYFLFNVEIMTELTNGEDAWLVGLIVLQLWRKCIIAVRNWPKVDCDSCWRNVYFSSPYTSHHMDWRQINYGRHNACKLGCGASLTPRCGGTDSLLGSACVCDSANREVGIIERVEFYDSTRKLLEYVQISLCGIFKTVKFLVLGG